MNVFSPIESSISDDGTRRLFATRPPHKFTFTVWANEIQLLGATRAKRTFVTANVRYSARSERLSAFFADSFQFQRHFFLFLEAISFVILSEAKNLGSIWVVPQEKQTRDVSRRST